MKTYSRVYFSLCLFLAISGRCELGKNLAHAKNFQYTVLKVLHITHMRNMIIFELLQLEFLLQGQHTFGYRFASCLVFIEETEKEEKGFNNVLKLHIQWAMLNLVLLM